MVGPINNTFVTWIKLNLHEFNYAAEIYSKHYLTNKLSNYNLILGRDLLHQLDIIFNFRNKTINWQEVSISMKPSNCTANKFFVIKESLPVGNVTKRIKQNLDAEYKKINLKMIVLSLNYLEVKY